MRTRHYDLDANRRMVWRLLLLVLFVELITLFFARRASAEPLKLSQSLLVVAQTADTAFTLGALNRGCVETNPLLGGHDATATRIVVTKSVLTIAALWGSSKLDALDHHTWARILNYAGTGSGTYGVVSTYQNCYQSLTLTKRVK